ncbi:C-signal-like [Pungitius pungitius]|uniref:C-signal-like n=1 Tax=Pungitius pungitius TaxID=134920 RepID=UPI001888F7BE|nr:C-signal-like [Pungitius pungitius]
MATKAASVLITGANRGLGLEMVKQMVEGSRDVKKLFACCRDPDGPRAEALQTLAKKHPDVIVVVRLDATDLSSIKQCAQQVCSVVGKGGLNLLINNAGVAVRTNLQETTPEELQLMFNTNVMGPMNVIKEFLPHLRAAAKASGTPGMSSGKAAVVNISSILGSIEGAKESYTTYPCISYRISKAALNMLTMCTAEELKKDEILLCVLHPGWVRTDMGGEEGDIGATESVQGMLEVMASLTEKQSAGFLDWKGRSIPW